MTTAAVQIQRCFNRAAPGYQKLAIAQQYMGELLWQARPQESPQQMIDLGCGPGHWTARLAAHYPDAQVLGVDLSPAMLHQARGCYPSLAWIQADAALLPLASASQNLVFSNLAIQWCPNSKQLFREIHRILKPGGRALISSLLPGSLMEISQAWQEAGVASRVVDFVPLVDYQQALQEAGFQEIQLEARQEVFYYPTSRDLLQSITGVGASGGAGYLSKSQYRAIHQKLEELRTSAGLPLTYQLLLMELHL